PEIHSPYRGQRLADLVSDLHGTLHGVRGTTIWDERPHGIRPGCCYANREPPERICGLRVNALRECDRDDITGQAGLAGIADTVPVQITKDRSCDLARIEQIEHAGVEHEVVAAELLERPRHRAGSLAGREDRIEARRAAMVANARSGRSLGKSLYGS